MRIPRELLAQWQSQADPHALSDGLIEARDYAELQRQDAQIRLWLPDPARIGQVLGNLLSNALRHTPAGGRVDVEVLPDGDSVSLSPFTVILSVLVWSLVLGGLLGALLAVPLTATIKVLLQRYVWHRRV